MFDSELIVAIIFKYILWVVNYIIVLQKKGN